MTRLIQKPVLFMLFTVLAAAMPGFEVLSALFGLPPAPVVQIDPDSGDVTPVVLQDPDNDVFDVPLSLAVSVDGNNLFVTNGALPIGRIPPNPGPGVVEVGLGSVAAAVPEPSSALLLAISASALALLIVEKRRLKRQDEAQ